VSLEGKLWTSGSPLAEHAATAIMAKQAGEKFLPVRHCNVVVADNQHIGKEKSRV
jgi:hypothetical protein